MLGSFVLSGVIVRRRPWTAPGRGLERAFASKEVAGDNRGVRVSPDAFEQLVADALDRLPAELGAVIENVAVLRRAMADVGAAPGQGRDPPGPL